MDVADESYMRMAENPQAGDEMLYVRFFMEPVHDKKQSEAAGRPIYVDQEHVEIVVPGDKTMKVCAPVNEQYKRRFPKQYANFKQRLAEPTEGTPLREWPQIGRSEAENLSYHGVKTVEQLAALNEATCQNIGRGVLALARSAKDFMAKAKEHAPAVQLRSELEKRDNEIEVLKRQMAQMATLLSAKDGPEPVSAPGSAEAIKQEAKAIIAEADAPKRRGRPPKALVAQEG